MEPDDLQRFGLILEFIGRLPVLATLEDLDEVALIKILTEPKNALLVPAVASACSTWKMSASTFTEDALSSPWPARPSSARPARGACRSIAGSHPARDYVPELPTFDGVEEVVVNAEVVEGRAQPLLIYAEKQKKDGAA